MAPVDPGGALRVGPESAGADPGPAAYGRGGDRVTVTDAHVHLGRLLPEGFLGGRGSLDPGAVDGPLKELAREAGCTPTEAAEGVLEVVNTAMEGALRVISVERGVDPSEYHLVAFGGAAGLHAAELVARLGLKGALLPPDPGLLSAWGMLVAPVVRDRSRTVFLSSREPGTDDRIRELMDEMAGEARTEMEEEGTGLDGASVRHWVDARYRGQSFELRVEAEDWVGAFHRAHKERYGYAREDREVEAVTLRVRVEAPGQTVSPPPPPARSKPEEGEERPVTWRGKELGAKVFRRGDLVQDQIVEGPALILEYSSTTWCPPDWEVSVHPSGTLVLRPA
jgi:N-methylhydantoinase A